MLQDVQFAFVAALPAEARAEEERAFAERYRSRAEREPQPAWLVLAARVEPDRLAAERLLEDALEIDDSCIWARYALAHERARGGEFARARQDLERALDLDPGHLPSRRLEINLLARAGETEGATYALRAWLSDAVSAEGRADPFIGADALAEGRVDLATLLVLSGGAEEAEALLSTRGELPAAERARAELVLAAALYAQERPAEALEASRAAAAAGDGGALSLIQEALILEHDLGDLSGALEAWDAAAERLSGGGASTGDLSWLLQLLQARVRAERLADVVGSS